MILKIILLISLAWVIFNISMLIIPPRTIGAYSRLSRVYIPKEYYWTLTKPELLAIFYHELGHITHKHAIKNCIKAIFFIKRKEDEIIKQECEADDFAIAFGAQQSDAGKITTNDLITALMKTMQKDTMKLTMYRISRLKSLEAT